MSSVDPTTPLIAVGIVVSLFIFCCYTIINRRLSAEDDDDLPIRSVELGSTGGLDATEIESFPTFMYSEVKHLTIGKGALECAVCLNEFEDDEILKLLPKCDHVFHSECISKWLTSRTTCPVCRDDVGKCDEQELAPVDRSSVTIEVAEEGMVDGGGLKKSTMWSKFPRSHSTGHSLVQQGESVDRFTLNLPVQIRNKIMTRALNQSTSVVVLPSETSSKEGGRAAAGGGGGGEGSGRGNLYRRIGSLDRPERWMFNMALPVAKIEPVDCDG